MMDQKPVVRCCRSCRHFNNEPAYLEKTIAGLKVFGSGYSSVKKDDGICCVTERYLSGDNICRHYCPK